MPRSVLIAALACGLSLPAAAAPRAQGAATVTAGPGVDTNPARTVGEAGAADGFLGATASGRGRVALTDDQTLTGRFDLGGRKFLTQADQDLLASQLEAGWSSVFGAALVGVDGSGKLRRTRIGDRDYTDLSASAFGDWAFSRTLSARLSAGARRFLYPANPAYSSSGPVFGASARFTPERRQALSLGVQVSPRKYAANARLSAQGDEADELRRDWLTSAQLAWSYRGPLALQAGYSLSVNRSNSFGESTTRHRLFGVLTARLPFNLIATGEAALELIRYPDGIFLSSDLLLLDDEAQSTLGGKLAWPMTESLDLEGRWAVYAVDLPRTSEVSLYLRQTASVGVTARW